MFESVEVRLNGQPFNGASCAHAGYKAYIETLLSYDTDARNTHLNSQFLHMDSPQEYWNMSISEYRHKSTVIEALKRGALEPPEIPAAYRAREVRPGEPAPAHDRTMLLQSEDGMHRIIRRMRDLDELKDDVATVTANNDVLPVATMV